MFWVEWWKNVLHGGMFGKMLEMKEHSDSKWKNRMFGERSLRTGK